MFGFDRKQLACGVILICAVVFGAGYKTAQVREEKNFRPVITDSVYAGQEEKNRTVTVYITGAVKSPGVYTFPEGSRILDAVNKAGAAKDADLTCINLAELMSDQQQVTVPRQGEADADNNRIAGRGTNLSGARSRQPAKININTADAAALESLPGIGPATARKIIDYRTEHGRFKSISELLQVSGIGEKKFTQIKDLITI